MATSIDEKSGLTVFTNDVQSYSHENDTDIHQSRSNDTGSCVSCRGKLKALVVLVVKFLREASRPLFFIACAAYNSYLIWLLVYLKDNRNYWFLTIIHGQSLALSLKPFLTWQPRRFTGSLTLASVIMNLMLCFTMLTRLAHYHSQPDQFIGPRFIIVSLKGSVVLFFFAFLLRNQWQMELLLEEKDVIARVLLDFVDIFDMVEVLSANKCVGIGSFLSEGSPTEMAIQAFCTMSFMIPFAAFEFEARREMVNDRLSELIPPRSKTKALASVSSMSVLLQNVPFLIIRITIWFQYNLYSLGFLVKNVSAIVICSAEWYIDKRRARKDINPISQPECNESLLVVA